MIRTVEDFNKRLDKALAFRNLKPADLAKRTDLSEATISQYRSGYTTPKSDKLMLISTVLGVSPAWLMGLDVPMIDDMEVKNVDTEYSDNDRYILFCYHILTPEAKEIVDDIFRKAYEKSKAKNNEGAVSA